MSNQIKLSRAKSLARLLKAGVSEVVRRYHNALPDFVEMYAGSPQRPGPVFAKEVQVLFSLARLLMPVTVLEIGVGRAASTVAFAEAIRLNGRGHLFSIDIDEGLIRRAQLVLNTHRLSPFATIIRGQSADPETRRLVAAKATQVDILFIDGDHSFTGCYSDFEAYRSLLAPAGLIIFHDTGPFPPSLAGRVAKFPLNAGESNPEWNQEGSAIYHRPDVAKVVDAIIGQYSEYSLLSLHTLAEPCCGLAILQRVQKVYQPRYSEAPK